MKPAQIPFQGSFLCIDQPVRRLAPGAQVNVNGVASYYLPLVFGLVGRPALNVTPGSAWNFQFLHRDSRSANGPLLNFSNGLRIVFEP